MNNEGIRAEPVQACPLCGRDGTLLQDGLQDRIFDAPGSWAHRFCAACDHAWLDPRPIASDITRLYATYFTHDTTHIDDHRLGRIAQWSLGSYGYRNSSAAPEWVLRVTPGLRDLGAGEFYWLTAVPNGRLLDVGCGSGLFLARTRELGWQVSGVEHVPDALALLASVCRPIRPMGQLVVGTPNTRSIGRRILQRNWIHWDPPRHLHLFSARSLALVAQRAGFESKGIRTTARSARFAWTASRTIGSTGRADVGRIRGPLQWQSLAFQALESAVLPVWPSAGEELILTASPQPRVPES